MKRHVRTLGMNRSGTARTTINARRSYGDEEGAVEPTVARLHGFEAVVVVKHTNSLTKHRPLSERKSDKRVRLTPKFRPLLRMVTGHPYPVRMTIPSTDSLKHISDRLKANDIAWFKDRFHAGEFSWLKEHLPEGGYTTLGERIEAGDLGYVRTLLRGLALPGFGTLFGATAVGTAATVGAAKASTAIASSENDDRKKKGAVWLLPVALLGAILLGFGLSRLGDDKNSTTPA